MNLLRDKIKRRSFVSRQIAPVTLLSLFSCISDYGGSILSTVIVGGAFSEEGLVVTGIVAPILTFILFICDMFCGSAVYLCNVSIAEGDEDKGSRYIGNTLIIVLSLGALLSLALYLFPQVYLSFFGLSPEIFAISVRYIKAIAIHPVLYIMAYYCYEILFRMERKLPLVVSILVNSVGIAVFGMCFIRIWGIVGMAYAIVLADIITLAAQLLSIWLRRIDFKISFGFSKEDLLLQLKHGFSYAQDTVYYPVYSAVIYAFIGNNFGQSCMAVFAIIECISEFASLFYGVSYAAENYLCMYVGEENGDGIKKTVFSALRIQTVIALVVMTACLIFAQPIAAYMGMEAEYGTETIRAIRIYVLGFIPLSYLCFMGDYFCDIEKYDSSIVLCAGKTLLAGIAGTVALGLIFGNIGIYIGKALESAVGIVIAVIYNRVRHRAKNPLFIGTTDNISSFDYCVLQNEIIKTRDFIEAELRRRRVNENLILKTMLVFEEASMLILENNSGKKLYAECTLIFGKDSYEMILRDNGRITDLSDADRDVTSLRSYLVSSMVEKYVCVRHISEASINRLTFSFQLNEQ